MALRTALWLQSASLVHLFHGCFYSGYSYMLLEPHGRSLISRPLSKLLDPGDDNLEEEQKVAPKKPILFKYSCMVIAFQPVVPATLKDIKPSHDPRQ